MVAHKKAWRCTFGFRPAYVDQASLSLATQHDRREVGAPRQYSAPKSRAAPQQVHPHAPVPAAIDAERAALAEKRRRQELQRAQRERAAAGGSSRHHRNAGLTAEFLEEADDDDFVAHEHGDAELARVDRCVASRPSVVLPHGEVGLCAWCLSGLGVRLPDSG